MASPVPVLLGAALMAVPLGGATAAGEVQDAPASQDTLTLQTVLDQVGAGNPTLRAVRLRADAALERVPQAGALPDPMLGLGLMNRPLDDFGPSEPMTMNALQLTQRIPWPGKRGFARDQADRLARAERSGAEEIEASLVARAKAVYYRLAFVDRAIEIMETTRSLLEDFQEVTTARYAVGSGIQQDVLQAQVAVARMRADIRVMREDRLATAARLNSLMGKPADTPVGALELGAAEGEMPPLEVLLERASERRPALREARERLLAAEAGVRGARRDFFPDLTVTLGYGQRPRFDDMASLMVGVSLPVWAGSRQAPRQRELEALQALEEARGLDVYNETWARLAELRAQAERAFELSRLYRTSVVPQATAAVESALSAYRVGQVDYMTLLTNQMTVNQYEVELVRLAAEFQEARAEIEALTGTTLGGGS